MEGKWPERVGLLALEVYFPSLCVDQAELEKHDGISAGKYTIGLGQTKMGFCNDNEDIHSLCLTVVNNLMEKNRIPYEDIGRLEVGTETIIDKSKSVKTVLMQLFSESGNTSIEGIDTTNACFGGTSALFNAVSWVESSAWDGRFAVVVAGDIAVYASGNARPTGGAGAVAMLIGPNAPLYFERGLRAVHMDHVYDFYKPDLSSEYPVVDGHLSIRCYLQALDKCYCQYAQKYSHIFGEHFNVSKVNWFSFHSPFTKLVQKSFARMYLNDFLSCEEPDVSEGGPYAGMEDLKGRTLEDTLVDKGVEKTCMKASEMLFTKKTLPTLLLAKQVGNMYTASLYGGLASLLAQKTAEEVAGTRIMAFSYGSGLASALYSLKFTQDRHLITRLVTNCSDTVRRLEERKCLLPEEFERILKLREETHHLAPYQPTGMPMLFPGTYHLTGVDEKHRRFYQRVPPLLNEGGLPPLLSPCRSSGKQNGH